MIFLRHILSGAIFLALISWGYSSQAEEDENERLYGLTVDSIEILSTDNTPKSELLELSGLNTGSPLGAGDIRRAVKLFYQLGRYENVYVFGRRLGNVVQLQIKLIPRTFLKEIEILGAEYLSSAEIEERLGLDIGRTLDIDGLQESRKQLAKI